MAEKLRVTTREVACDFFRVNTGTSGRYDFISIINSIYAAKAAASDRNVTIDDGILRLHDWQVHDNDASGGIVAAVNRSECQCTLGVFKAQNETSP